MAQQTTLEERAKGALLGAFVGEALAVGPHWYYDLQEMRRQHGEWVTDYCDPKPGRYHENLKAGQISQPGYLLKLTLQSLVAEGEYSQADFCRRLDTEFFPLLNGEPMAGPGGYTSQSIREMWERRVQQRKPWHQTGGQADTTEAIERNLAIAVRYAREPGELARAITANTVLSQVDEAVVAMTVAFGAVLGQLVKGEPFDYQLSGKLMGLVKRGELPFHAVTSGNLQPPQPGEHPLKSGTFSSPDALLTPSCIATAAQDPEVRIEPAWKVSLVYGMPCAIYHQLPAVYYLAARFRSDFESAVLHAVNGGGQNQARAMLTGALVGAQVGLAGIPERFITGLEEGTELLDLAESLARSLPRS